MTDTAQLREDLIKSVEHGIDGVLFDMTQWLFHFKEEDYCDDWKEHREYFGFVVADNREDIHSCGTAACIGGHLQAIACEPLHDMSEREAADMLDVPYEAVQRLFFPKYGSFPWEAFYKRLHPEGMRITADTHGYWDHISRADAVEALKEVYRTYPLDKDENALYNGGPINVGESE